MFGHWFADNLGIATFAAALVSIVGAALVVRHVCRRYSGRPSVALSLGVLAVALLLPWLSARAAVAAAPSQGSGLPTASAATFLRELDAGKVHRLATAADVATVPRSTTVFATGTRGWRRAEVAPARLAARQRAEEARVAVTSLPAAVQEELAGGRNPALVAFMGIESLEVVAGALAVASVVDRPRRVDLDQALAELLAEHHGRETV